MIKIQKKNSSYYQWEILKAFSDKMLCGNSTRRGGKSQGQYASFNLALHCGDVSQHVLANRRLFCDDWDVSLDSLCCAQQVHSSRAVVAGTSNRGAGSLDQENAIKNCDCLLTAEKGIMLMIFTADCVPVLLYDKKNNAGGICHAGWKGTAAGILLKAVETMRKVFSSCPEDIIAGIGPSIGADEYAIDEERASVFKQLFKEKAGLVLKKIENEKRPRFYLDLKKSNALQLEVAGLKAENIEIATESTLSQPDFFSFRGSGGNCGRTAAFFYLL